MGNYKEKLQSDVYRLTERWISKMKFAISKLYTELHFGIATGLRSLLSLHLRLKLLFSVMSVMKSCGTGISQVKKISICHRKTFDIFLRRSLLLLLVYA